MLRAGSLVACLAIGMIVAGGLSIAGCALSDPEEAPPAIDPSLPDLDAATNASPVANPASADDAGGRPAAKSPGDAGTDAETITPDDTGAPPPPLPTAGEIVVSEILYDPSGDEPSTEWFEIYNAAGAARTLSGLTLTDGGGRTHVIGPGVAIDAGAYAVLARDQAAAVAASVPAGAILYEYGAHLGVTSGVLLLNGATGSIALSNGGATIASVAYGGWFSSIAGRSLQMKGTDPANEGASSSWCASSNAWAAGSDDGTPGAPTDCP